MSRRKTRSTRAVEPPPTSLGSSPQHQCLRNSDLLEEILRHFKTEDSASRNQTRRTLYSVAQTCKGLSHSALKLLWRRLDNLLPLLRLLPSLTLEGKIYHMPGLVGDAEWAIFDRHAAHVREIIYMQAARRVDPVVYVRLAMRKLPLLPNLERFECTTYEPAGSLYSAYRLRSHHCHSRPTPPLPPRHSSICSHSTRLVYRSSPLIISRALYFPSARHSKGLHPLSYASSKGQFRPRCWWRLVRCRSFILSPQT
ncbi:hypothetical protein C8R44DRAFT_328984 [Mycena epipterygia]|nr:hypothetical protein C8R44DRAFT_328984 [Mycena epipterygia]